MTLTLGLNTLDLTSCVIFDMWHCEQSSQIVQSQSKTDCEIGIRGPKVIEARPLLGLSTVFFDIKMKVISIF